MKLTREEWLLKAVDVIRNAAPDGMVIPPVNVSCSWPGGGSPQKRIGECWQRKASKAGVNEIFISPKLEDPARVIGVLAHELMHAVDDCVNGHKAGFTALCRSFGFEGKPTQMGPTAEVAQGWATWMVEKHGNFPHRTLDKSASGQKKQTTRMLKCECHACGAVWRMSAKHIEACEHGMWCPVCGEVNGKEGGDE